MATKRFTLNGSAPKDLGEIARDVLQDFADKHPDLTAQDIRDIFVAFCRNVGVPHIVETEPEYHLRDGQKSQARTVKEVITPGGEKLYMSTQWHAGKPGDDFFKFKGIVNAEGWGKII